eukprot:c11431_g1_i1 orf=129-1562(+)
MAVVENAADGLALSLPTLGLGLPCNLAHLGSETDQSLQIQLHHHYPNHHHLQLHHHQHLLLQENTPKLSHFDEDQRAQQSGPSLPKMETFTPINADPAANLQTLTSIDGIITSQRASTDDITSNLTSVDGITSTLTSADSITLNPTSPDGKTDCSAAVTKTLTQANSELGSGETLIDGGDILADSRALTPATNRTEIAVNVRTINDGNAPNLPIKLADADALMQFGKDSMCKLEDRLSNLNPLAKEFVPSSPIAPNAGVSMGNSNLKKKSGHTQGRRRVNGRTSKAQRDESIRRTVYVSDIDQQVTEEQLAALFITCGPVVDCRVCGDPNSVLRFAFVEFMNEGGARAALSLAGTMLGYYPVRVLPSKTAIVPVNPTFLPQSEEERGMCAKTVYCTNVDKKVSQADVKLFFERLCGEVARLRLLGDYRHSTRIAFVEFVRAESAMAALNCSGAILGSLPLRVSPSKTPVRPRSPRNL